MSRDPRVRFQVYSLFHSLGPLGLVARLRSTVLPRLLEILVLWALY